MKTIEEMDKEEDQLIEALLKIGQESREILFNSIKLNVVFFLVLVGIVLMLGSDIVIAWTCMVAVGILSLDMIVLLSMCLWQKISLLRLKALMKMLRDVEILHQAIIQAGQLVKKD